MVSVIIYSDFGAQENKVHHCFYCFPIYLLWSDGTRCHDFSFWMLKVKVRVTQLCLTLCSPVDYTVHGILQATTLLWVSFPFFRGSSQPQGQKPGVPHCRQILYQLNHKPTFSLSSFTFIKRLYGSSSLSAIRVVSSAYLRLLIFLTEILIPACASSRPAFHMMYSA